MTQILFSCFILIFSSFFQILGFAQDYPIKPFSTIDEAQSMHHEEHVTVDTFQDKFFNMLVILALLVAFMILASWALKKLMKSKITQLNTSSHIKLLETRYLSPRATLYLVEVDKQVVLISESPTTVNYLTHITPNK